MRWLWLRVIDFCSELSKWSRESSWNRGGEQAVNKRWTWWVPWRDDAMPRELRVFKDPFYYTVKAHRPKSVKANGLTTSYKGQGKGATWGSMMVKMVRHAPKCSTCPRLKLGSVFMAATELLSTKLSPRPSISSSPIEHVSRKCEFCSICPIYGKGWR